MDNELEQQGYLEKPQRRRERTAPESKGFGDEPKVEEVKVEEKKPEPTPEPVVEEKKPEPAPEPVVEEKKPEPKPTPKPKKEKKAPAVEPPKRVRKTKVVRPSRPNGDSIRGIRRRFS